MSRPALAAAPTPPPTPTTRRARRAEEGRRAGARGGPARRLLARIGAALSFVAFAAALLAGLVLVAVPAVAGAQTYTILTGSMEPGYPPGTFIVSRPVDPDDIAVGDIVTYQLESGQPTVVTHRVVGFSATQQGERTFITQGDANNAPDPQPILPVQVRGELFYAVPLVGHVASWLGLGFGAVGGRGPIVLIVAVALIGYGAVTLALGWRSARRERRRADRAGGATP